MRRTKRTSAPRTARRSANRAGEAELLAEIYAAPDDDAPRLVYADWLQECSDPRGEFIALQIERARGKARSGGRQRENALFAKHRKAWERPLEVRGTPAAAANRGAHRIEREVVFERGFADHVASWTIGMHPAWSTVRSCTAAPHDDGCHVGALRAITAARDEDIVALAKLRKFLAVERLAWEHAGNRPYDKPPKALTAQLSNIAVLPALRHLALGPWAVGKTPAPRSLAWAWSSPLAGPLESLRVPGHDVGGWLEVLASTKLARLELAWINFQPCMSIACEAQSLAVIVERSTREALAVLTREVARLPRSAITSARVAIHLQAEWNKSTTQRAALQRAFDKARIDATIVKAAR